MTELDYIIRAWEALEKARAIIQRKNRVATFLLAGAQ